MRLSPPDVPRILTLAEVHRMGATRSALRHAATQLGWSRLACGVYLTAPGPPSRDDWILTGLALAGPRAALSGWDALRIVGIAPAQAVRSRVLILDRDGKNRTVGHVRIRPTQRPYAAQPMPAEHPTLPFVPVVPVARAIADAALVAGSLAPVRAMVTRAVQRGSCQPADLLAELANCPRAGSHWLRVALQDVANGSLSVAEAEAADRLWAAHVPAFEQNVPVLDASGRLIAVVDVLWRALRAVLEIDSREFHFSERDWRSTMNRHNLLIGCGLAVRHDAPSMIRSSGSAWGQSVRAWLDRRAIELGVELESSSTRTSAAVTATPPPFRIAG